MTLILDIRVHTFATEQQHQYQSVGCGNEKLNWTKSPMRESILLTEVPFSKQVNLSPLQGCFAVQSDLWPPCGDSCSCSFSCRKDQQNVKSKMPSYNTWSVAEVDRFLTYMLLNRMWQAAESTERTEEEDRNTDQSGDSIMFILYWTESEAHNL